MNFRNSELFVLVFVFVLGAGKRSLLSLLGAAI